MRCDEIDELIEELAAPEAEPGADLAAHVAACRRCGRALAIAGEIDRLLASDPVVDAPAGFAARVLARVSHERWRAERSLDLWFNLAIAASLALVVSGIVLLLNLSGLSAVAADVSGLFAAGLAIIAERVSVALPVYASATALLVMGLGVWWWAEGKSTL